MKVYFRISEELIFFWEIKSLENKLIPRIELSFYCNFSRKIIIHQITTHYEIGIWIWFLNKCKVNPDDLIGLMTHQNLQIVNLQFTAK